MARERKPAMTIDPLQPDGTCRSFRATWTEQNLCASAHLEPLQDDPRNGYTLECWYDRISTRGAMGQRQEEFGRTLVHQVRAYMQTALLDAGWMVAETGPDANTLEIWKHQSQRPSAPIQQESPPEPQPASQDSQSQPERQAYKTIEVYGNKEARERGQGVAYRRVISARSIMVTCATCGREETQQHYPGPTPRYCGTCAEKATRECTRQRVQRLRKRQQEQAMEPRTVTAKYVE